MSTAPGRLPPDEDDDLVEDDEDDLVRYSDDDGFDDDEDLDDPEWHYRMMSPLGDPDGPDGEGGGS